MEFLFFFFFSLAKFIATINNITRNVKVKLVTIYISSNNMDIDGCIVPILAKN